MRAFAIIVILPVLMISCGNKKTASLPPPPSSIDSVASMITGKTYKAAELALISTLISDKNNPYEWFDEIKDTTPFFRNYEMQKLKFAIYFMNDTIAELTDEAATNKATWKLDDQPKSDETAGIFLRFTMEKDEQTLPGQSTRSTITFSYKVLGIDEQQLFLQTPNVLNMRKTAVVMKTNQH
jgi:hypothetical protein